MQRVPLSVYGEKRSGVKSREVRHLTLEMHLEGLGFQAIGRILKISYEEFIPEDKHIPSKAETYTIEEYSSRIRHYLARFKRKGKCYPKAEYMI